MVENQCVGRHVDTAAFVVVVVVVVIVVNVDVDDDDDDDNDDCDLFHFHPLSDEKRGEAKDILAVFIFV